MFLKWCRRKDIDIDIAILREAWNTKDRNTEFKGGYNICTRERKVVIYIKVGMKNNMKSKKVNEQIVVVEVDSIRIGEVYMKVK